jgi:predicted ATP-dependent endonuclease of OLD family
MRLSKLTVKNYRGLREISIPLSRFGCLIGKNNAGKSTILQAIALFYSGTKLSSKDFYDATKPIRIEVCFDDIGEADLARLAPEHREKIEPIIVDRKLTLVRNYDTSGTGKMMYVTLFPKDERFKSEKIAGLIKGLSKGELLTAFVGEFPECSGKFTAGNINQGKVKEEISAIAAQIPADQKELADCDLPTGIDASVKSFLPEPIYIPAVKNLADDVKASQSTPFGKVLSILLEAIEPQLGDEKAFFAELSKKFNRVVDEHGQVTDNRMPEVKKIETTVETYLRESFANVSFEINVPPPELKAILSSAEILIDDGVKGGIESKGDGLRRATVFAILRSYVALNEPGALLAEQAQTLSDRHILLFEEPELYLHPSAQKILFDALSIFSKHNHVLITTHSPAFFGPTGTASFIKLDKVSDAAGQVPHTRALAIDLSELRAKDQFQLICFENNNAAFFFDSVILVEGDSDYIVLPHVASLLMPKWEVLGSAYKFVRIHGKGSIKRYKEFFKKFEVRVAVVTDLDLLTGGFDSIEPDAELQGLRNHLLGLVDAEILANGGFKEMTKGKAGDAQDKTELLGLWNYAKETWGEVQANKAPMEKLVEVVDRFFSWEKKSQRLDVLMTTKSASILSSKQNLLAKLRQRNIFVLERGDLESYYPATVVGVDKPTKAQDFCRKVGTKTEVLSLCGDHCDEHGTSLGKEFEVICSGLFGIPLQDLRV